MRPYEKTLSPGVDGSRRAWGGKAQGSGSALGEGRPTKPASLFPPLSFPCGIVAYHPKRCALEQYVIFRCFCAFTGQFLYLFPLGSLI